MIGGLLAGGQAAVGGDAAEATGKDGGRTLAALHTPALPPSSPAFPSPLWLPHPRKT